MLDATAPRIETAMTAAKMKNTTAARAMMSFVFCGSADHPDLIEATTGDEAIDDSGDDGDSACGIDCGFTSDMALPSLWWISGSTLWGL
jgi:hypothetical protein